MEMQERIYYVHMVYFLITDCVCNGIVNLRNVFTKIKQLSIKIAMEILSIYDLKDRIIPKEQWDQYNVI